jgi:chemotaxis protein MotB
MRWRTLLAPAFLGVMVAGCGYSEEEWQAQLDKYNKLSAQNQGTESKLAQTQRELDEA